MRGFQKNPAHKIWKINYTVSILYVLQDLNKRSIRKRSSGAGIKGIKGVFIVDGVILPPASAILRIRKEVKYGKRVWVEWSYNSYKIRRAISTEFELNELISEIKSKVD